MSLLETIWLLTCGPWRLLPARFLIGCQSLPGQPWVCAGRALWRPSSLPDDSTQPGNQPSCITKARTPGSARSLVLRVEDCYSSSLLQRLFEVLVPLWVMSALAWCLRHNSASPPLVAHTVLSTESATIPSLIVAPWVQHEDFSQWVLALITSAKT